MALPAAALIAISGTEGCPCAARPLAAPQPRQGPSATVVGLAILAILATVAVLADRLEEGR